MNNFEKDLKIDLYNLHIECRDFPNLYFQYAQKFAKASEQKFKKEEQLKLLKADVKLEIDQARASMDLEIRGNLEKFQKQFGIKKLTESGIISLIVTNPDFIELQKRLSKEIENKTKEVAKAIEELETYRAAMVSLSHKKSGIEDAVKLHLGGYYSEPKTENKLPKKGNSTLRERQNK